MDAYECVPCSSREDWLEKRKAGIGASECAAILGFSRYENAYSLWARRTGRAPAREATPQMLAGLEWEPHVRAKFERLAPDLMDLPTIQVRYREHDLRRSRERPHVMATLDGWFRLGEEPCVLEVKTSDPSSSFSDIWAGEHPPAAVQAQVQMQLYVCGWQRAYVAAQIGLSNFRPFEVRRSDRFIAAMLPRLDAFWTHLETDSPPPADDSEATREALTHLAVEPDRTIVLEHEALALAADLDRATEEEATAKQAKRAIEGRIMRLMGSAERAVLPDQTGFTFKSVTRAAYTVSETTYRVLRRVKPRQHQEIES